MNALAVKIAFSLAILGCPLIFLAGGLELRGYGSAADVVGFTGLGMIAVAVAIGGYFLLREIWAL